jgi:histone H3/H4
VTMDCLRLWRAVELDDAPELRELARLMKEGRVTISQNEIDQGFALAVSSHQERLVHWFLEEFRRPSPHLLNQYFLYFSEQADDPDILDVLQNAVQPIVLAEAFRNLKHSGRYLVNVSEPVDVRDFYSHFTKTRAAASSKKALLACNLRFCAHFHDFLLDAVFSRRSWTVVRLLKTVCQYFPDENKLQSAVNDAFREAVKRHLYPVANLLALTNRKANRVQVSQEGFDSAVMDACHNMDLEVLAWLLSGRLGFAPAEGSLSALFRQYSLCLARETLGYQLNDSNSLVPVSYTNPYYRSGSRIRQQYFMCMLAITAAIKDRIGAEVHDSVNFEIDAEKRLIQLKRRRSQIRETVLRDSGPADIHSFSSSRVTAANDVAVEVENGGTPTDAENDGVDPEIIAFEGGPRSLNKSVLDYLRSRIDDEAARALYPDVESVSRRFVQLISDEFDDVRREDEALRVIASVLYERNIEVFRTTLAYLESLPREIRRQSQSLWLAGFVSESITEHSCQAGMLERVVTGLRGIDDPVLNRIFSQVEAPHLIRTFLSGMFNIYCRKEGRARCLALAELLMTKGIRSCSRAEDAVAVLLAYAKDSIQGYDSAVEKYEEEAMVMVESVMDSYDTLVRPLLFDRV